MENHILNDKEFREIFIAESQLGMGKNPYIDYDKYWLDTKDEIYPIFLRHLRRDIDEDSEEEYDKGPFIGDLMEKLHYPHTLNDMIESKSNVTLNHMVNVNEELYNIHLIYVCQNVNNYFTKDICNIITDLLKEKSYRF